MIPVIVVVFLLLVTPFVTSAAVAADWPSATYVRAGQFYLTKVIDKSPWGRYNLMVDVYKVVNDGNSQYDWYMYYMQQQSVPGAIAFGQTSYKNDRIITDYFAQLTWSPKGLYRAAWIVSYGPTASSGSSTVTTLIGCTAGAGFQGPSVGLSYSQSWSYTTPDVVITDRSDFSQYRAAWTHDCNEKRNVGVSTYTSVPGLTVLTTNNGPTRLYSSTTSLIFAHHLLWDNWERKTFTVTWINLEVKLVT